MKKIYAPWRDSYIRKTVHKPCDEREKDTCVFCKNLAENNDEKHFILKRFTYNFVALNLYPYNGGHLMVLPIAHKGTLDKLSSQERNEHFEVVNTSVDILEKILKPQGFNIGLNIGKAGGGGIPSHLHTHVLPRWESDTNFMPLLADTKPVSTDLVEIYKMLKHEFDKIVL